MSCKKTPNTILLTPVSVAETRGTRLVHLSATDKVTV